MSQPLSSYFSASQGLRKLSHQVQMLAELERLFRKAAPPPLAQASRVILFERQILTLGAENGAIAAKLRQLAPQLVQQLQANGAEVNGIRVKVQVANFRPGPTQRPRSLSSTGQRQIAMLAQTLPESPLRSALQRFVTNSKR